MRNHHTRTGQEGRNLSEGFVRFKQNCSHQCPVDCDTSSYMLSILAQVKMTQDLYKFMLGNKFPSTNVKFSPKTSFLEYMIYVASVCGMWFGSCVFETGMMSVKHFKFILNKRNNRQIFVKIIHKNQIIPDHGT